MRNNEASLKLRMAGPDLSGCDINVRDFLKSLEAIDRLVEITNNRINGDRAFVEIRLSENFKGGSFIANLRIVQHITDEALLEVLKNAPTIIEMLGLSPGTAAATGIGLVGFYLIAKGRSVKVLDTIPNSEDINVEINGDNNHVVVVGRDVLNLSQDPEIQESLWELGSVFKKEKLESIEIGMPSKDDLLKIGLSDAKYLSAPPLFDKEQDTEDLSEFSEFTEGRFIIERVAFERNLRWRLRKEKNSYGVQIADEEFFSKVVSRQLEFSAGDMIVGRVEHCTRMRPDGTRYTQNILVSVTDVIHRPKQAPLEPAEEK